jgi:S1-C subfamily serine protease
VIKRSWNFPIIVIAVLLAGCVRSTPVQVFTYNGTKYYDASSALAAHDRDVAAQIDALPAATVTLPAHAVIVLPDRDRLRPLVRSNFRGPAVVTDDLLNYAIAFQQRTLTGIAESITKSHLFQSVSVLERNDTLQPGVTDYDYLLVFEVKPIGLDQDQKWSGRWLLQKQGNLVKLNPSADLGVAPEKFMASFVASVQQNTLRLDAARTGPIPATVPAVAGANIRRVSGTGIVVAGDGAVITNAHVVQGCTAPEVVVNGERLTGTVKAQDGANDLALLQVPHHWTAVAQFRDGAGIRQGDSVVAVGYPLTGLLAPDVNVTTGAVSALSGIANDTRHLQFTAPVQAGNSGGPLLDMDGHVVGVVRAKLNALAVASAIGDIPQNINFAIKAAIVRNFLDANSVAYAASPGRHQLSAADVGDIARNFTVLIECSR